MKLKNLLVIMSGLAFLGGCSTVSGITDVFSSDEEEARLEGKRLSVLELESRLEPDTAAEKTPISIPQPWQNPSWPQAGGMADHVMQNPAFTGQFDRVWSSDIGAGATKELPLNAKPVLANGVIYTLDTKSKLTAINAQNGRVLWKKDVRKDGEHDLVVTGGVSYAQGFLYVTNGYDEVLAASADNGDIAWRKRLPTPSRAAPTVFGGRVFVSTIDSRLVALNSKDGSILWEYVGISEVAGLLGAASPAANNDIVVPVFSSGEMTALRVENGSVAWSDNLSSVQRLGGGLESLSDIKAMPVIYNGLIIAVSFSGKMVAIDERSGTRVWQRDISGSQTPWIAGNHIFMVTSANHLVALRIEDGGISWIEQLAVFENEKKAKNPIYWAGPVMASGRLVMTGSHGYIHVFNPANGKEIERVRTKKSAQIAPIVSNNMLYILADDGTLMAYR
ncbi:MAG: PQQ-binding-like beta-propeller repeat protein [Alphaproteobacteria bacterium]|nr:PQQ-binding-like beta-propeller repeat protein [Alphaproteobacteria bacterium]